MKNESIVALQVLNLVEIFVSVLLSKARSSRSAKKLINRRTKIEVLVRNFLDIPLEYNFFDNKMFSSRWTADDNSVPDVLEKKRMTIEQALRISKIFGEVLASNIYLAEDAEKLIKSKKKLSELIDDLFEMSPAFNLFEYKMYVKQAPLSSFKELSTWDHDIFIVCTADEVCEPYGFKSGDRVYSPHGSYETIIGVAPLWHDSDLPLAIWTANDSNQFRDSTRLVVGAWKAHDLKKLGFYLTSH